MATDTQQTKQHLTLADLCEAIADDKVATRLEGGDYLLSALDLRRMGRPDTLESPSELDEFEIPSELLAELDATLSDASIQ